MAISTINIGSSANKGDGDPLRSAFTKINNNFTDVNTRLVALEDGSISTSVIGNLKGSVFGDDSTLLVDGVNNLIPSSVIQGTEATNWDTAYGWGDHSAAGYQSATAPFTGDLTGSVFGDDSTLLVDGVNGVIPTSVLEGDITNPIRTGDVVIESTASPGSITLTQTGIGNISLSATAIDFNNSPIENFILSYITSGLTAPGSSVVAGNTEVTFNFSGSPTALTVEQDAITIGNSVTVNGFVGDIKGSVFADDSTVMVDAVNNTLHADTVNAVGFQGSLFGNGGLNSPLQLTSGLEGQTGNTIFINPQGSDTLVQMWGETVNLVTGPFNTYDSPYVQFKTEGAFKAHQGAYFDGNLIGDVTGSVFADDSTLLVDAVNGEIPGYVKIADLKTALNDGAGDYVAFKAWVLANL